MFAVAVHMILSTTPLDLDNPRLALTTQLCAVLDGPGTTTINGRSYLFYKDENMLFNASQDVAVTYQPPAEEAPSLLLKGRGGQHFSFPLKSELAGELITGHVQFQVCIRQQGVFMPGTAQVHELDSLFIVAFRETNPRLGNPNAAQEIGSIAFINLPQDDLANPLFMMWKRGSLDNNAGLALAHWSALAERLWTLSDNVAQFFPGVLRVYPGTHTAQGVKGFGASLCCPQVSHAVMTLAERAKIVNTRMPEQVSRYNPSAHVPKIFQPSWRLPAPLASRLGQEYHHLQQNTNVPIHILLRADGMLSVVGQLASGKACLPKQPFAPVKTSGNTRRLIDAEYKELFCFSIFHIVSIVLLDAAATGNEQIFLLYAQLQLYVSKAEDAFIEQLWNVAHGLARDAETAAYWFNQRQLSNSSDCQWTVPEAQSITGQHIKGLGPACKG
ncbi:hypothetical protein CBOM_01956 [Ceraceosorus bombacis]|uniref:Uncharacterized protein n=1 Tax=Ceraceosorus bombacis TaxID=401625 RepID=A0A0P1BEZ5_9BASI|nr:hypothetical protein CBOM_01956 [Ceraceosorus bombacis]